MPSNIVSFGCPQQQHGIVQVRVLLNSAWRSPPSASAPYPHHDPPTAAGDALRTGCRGRRHDRRTAGVAGRRDPPATTRAGNFGEVRSNAARRRTRPSITSDGGGGGGADGEQDRLPSEMDAAIEAMFRKVVEGVADKTAEKLAAKLAAEAAESSGGGETAETEKKKKKKKKTQQMTLMWRGKQSGNMSQPPLASTPPPPPVPADDVRIKSQNQPATTNKTANKEKNKKKVLKLSKVSKFRRDDSDLLLLIIIFVFGCAVVPTVIGVFSNFVVVENLPIVTPLARSVERILDEAIGAGFDLVTAAFEFVARIARRILPTY